MSETRGKVTFVGAGPGDPRLLTARAAEVLREAEVLVFDAAIHPDVLALVPEGASRRPAASLSGPDAIARVLAGEAAAGRRVVRITRDDPLLFAGGDAEGAAVATRGIPIEIVPGIGPLVAVGAFAGVTLTRSSDVSPSVAVLHVTSGHHSLHDWSKLATATDTLAAICDAETVAETARSLVFYGRAPDEPALLIESVSLPSQRVIETTLGEVPLLPSSSASRVVLVAGVQARRSSGLGWFEARPLSGKRVLVTRAREQAGKAVSLLRDRGADAVVMPTIEIHPPTDPAPMIEAVRELERYAWVVFTSANGVDRLFAELLRQGRDARAFGRSKIAAIGPGTAATLERRGLAADVVAKVFKGEGLVEELLGAIGAAASASPRVLLARAEVARDVVPEALARAGCAVDVVPVYKTCAPPRRLLDGLSALLEGGEIDVVTFTSSSTVDHLCQALGDRERAASLLARTCVASIGPITSETASGLGVRVDVTAEEHTLPGLVRAIEGYFDSAGSTGGPGFDRK